MPRRDDALALAYASSDAYEHFPENRALIAAIVGELGGRVQVDEQRFGVVVARLLELLDTNRTAPAVMRMMAHADALRIAIDHLDDDELGRLSRRGWRRVELRARSDLHAQVAATLDGLMAEPF